MSDLTTSAQLSPAAANEGARSVPALAVASPGAPLARTTIERRALREDDVLVDIRHSGICHSDVHQARDDWGGAIFPMVPGHEITGIVAAVGSKVMRFRPGDRAGVGVYVDSDGTCEYCVAGEEQLCVRAVTTYNGRDHEGVPTYGGYSRMIVVGERHVFRIPDALDMAAAAPLLCAGITVFTPLKRYQAAGRSVAVMGLGGLGHLAVRIAHAMGARVTVLSRSESKRQDGLRLGADDAVATDDAAALSSMEKRFDLILNTVSAALDLDPYLKALRTDGTLVSLAIPAGADSHRASAIVATRRSITGSNVGSLADTQEMLDFCAAHGIGAEIETVSADDAGSAWDRMLRGDVRYRFVIDVSTL